jgi:nitrogen-specific signal transduction histidine kinase
VHCCVEEVGVDEGAIEYTRALAHELKNPLGAAKGALELVLDPEVLDNAAEREHMTRLALRNVERALALVDDLRKKSGVAPPAPGGDAGAPASAPDGQQAGA